MSKLHGEGSSVRPSDELLRLQGQSLFLVGYAEEAEAIRGDVLRLAEEDGYDVHALVFRPQPESRMQYRRLVNMAKARLRENPNLEPWTGDRQFFYDTSAARGRALSAEQRDELARVMRLTPLTGVAVGIEAFIVRGSYHGIRKLEKFDEDKFAPSAGYWEAGVIGVGDGRC